jgi:hypothetical protein
VDWRYPALTWRRSSLAKLPELLKQIATYHELAVMPNSVARLVFRAVVVVLGKVRAADLLQMVVFGEIGSDQEDGCEGEPGKQNESDHHKLHRWIGRG